MNDLTTMTTHQMASPVGQPCPRAGNLDRGAVMCTRRDAAEFGVLHRATTAPAGLWAFAWIGNDPHAYATSTDSVTKTATRRARSSSP